MYCDAVVLVDTHDDVRVSTAIDIMWTLDTVQGRAFEAVQWSDSCNFQRGLVPQTDPQIPLQTIIIKRVGTIVASMTHSSVVQL